MSFAVIYACHQYIKNSNKRIEEMRKQNQEFIEKQRKEKERKNNEKRKG